MWSLLSCHILHPASPMSSNSPIYFCLTSEEKSEITLDLVWKATYMHKTNICFRGWIHPWRGGWMLIDDDATSPLRLWPQVELGIKRLKHLKKKADRRGLCNMWKKASNHGQHGKTLSDTKAQSHDHNMGHLWRMCKYPSPSQPWRNINITRYAVFRKECCFWYQSLRI